MSTVRGVDLGDPDGVAQASQEIGRQAAVTVLHGRAARAAGAQACQEWRGGGAMAAARRSHAHVQACSALSTSLDTLSSVGARHALHLGHLSTSIVDAQRRYEQVSAEIERLQATLTREGRLLEPHELVQLRQELELLSRVQAQYDNAVTTALRELERLRAAFREELLQYVPVELYQWWVDGVATWSAVKTGRSILADVAVLRTVGPAIQAHRAATAAGDAVAAAAALRSLAQVRLAAAAPGRISTTVQRGSRILAALPPEHALRRGAASPPVRWLRAAPAGRLVRRFVGPLGAADLVVEGVREVADADGAQGIQAGINRSAGVLQTAGALMTLFPPTATAGAAVVLGVGIYKAARALWGKRESVARFVDTSLQYVHERDDTPQRRAEQNLRQQRARAAAQRLQALPAGQADVRTPMFAPPSLTPALP